MKETKQWYLTFIVGSVIVCTAVYKLNTKERIIHYESSNAGQHNDIKPVSRHDEILANDVIDYTKTPQSGTEIAVTSQKCDNSEFHFKKVSQEDQRLIDCIRRMIKPPSQYSYKLKYPEKVHFSQHEQSLFADKLYFHGMRDGFFVEVGALDGEHLSNTLYFERELGWRGLLIEPLPHRYHDLLKKNRKAFSIHAALATDTSPSEVSFLVDGINGGLSHIVKTPDAKIMEFRSKLSSLNITVEEKPIIKVRSLPLYSILKAMNVTVVDFFSLDIEAYEVKILKTLPWDKVKFRLMCIEVNHIPEGLPHLIKYLTGKGYKYLGKKVADAWFGWPDLLNKKECASCQ